MKSKILLKSILLFCFISGFYISNAQTYQWAKKGVSQGYDYGNSIVADDSGNVYIGGQIEYSANFDGIILNSHGKHDILVGKYNTNGNIQWIKNAGGLGGDVAWGVSIDKFHNVYLAGEFELTAIFSPTDSISSAGANDIFIVKYGPAGNVLWLRRIGSEGDDKAKAIAVSSDGSIYVTGYFSSNTTFGSFNVTSAGGNDFFIAKYSASGICQWVKKAGGSLEDRGRGVVLDPFGNLFVVGTFTNSINFNGTNYPGANTMNAFIAKYDTSGNFQWAKTAGACCDTSRYNGVTCDTFGNAYVTGYFKNTMNIGTNSLTTNGNSDVVIAKYSSSGNELWARNEGGNSEDMGYHLNFDNRKNLLYVTGFYDYQADFDTIHLVSAGNRDAFLAAYDPKGRVQWARTAGGNERDYGQDVTSDTLGNIYETGFFNKYADFDATHLVGDTLADFFVTKSSPALASQPSTASTLVTATLANCSDVMLNWSPGNGSNRIVVVRSSQSRNVFPSDGNSYNANAAFGSGTNLGDGNFVVYNESGDSTLITGLTKGIQYFFTVIEYNGKNNTSNYNTSNFASASFTVNDFAMNLSSSIPAICSGSQTTLSVSGGVSYQWSPSYGLSSITGSSVNASPGISTTYTVEGINNNGCHSIEQIIVYVNQLPAVQYDNTSTVCENVSPVILSGGIPSGGSYSGVAISNGSFNPVTAGTGFHVISYTYTDANGCSATDTTSIFVNPLPVITMPAFTALCSNGQTVILNGALPAGGIYSGNDVTAGTFDPTVTGPGTSTITYTYTDNHGCQNSGSANLLVNSAPVVTMGVFQELCQNATPLALTGGTPAGGTYSGTGVSSNIFSPSLAGPGNNIIIYSYTDNHNCTGTTIKSINVRGIPNIDLGSDTVVCAGAIIRLDAGSGFANYHWSTGATTQTTQISMSGAGTINCFVTVTDSYSCSNTDTIQITFDGCSGIATIKTDYPWCYIYPNLFTSSFTMFSEKKLFVKIYDVSGRLIEEDECEGSMVAGQNLSPGVYFIDAIFNNERKTYKVVKVE